MTDLNNRDDFADALAAAVAGIHASGSNYIPQPAYRLEFVTDVVNFIFGMDEQVSVDQPPLPFADADG